VKPPVIKVKPIGVVRSALSSRTYAPKQGSEGAPDAWLELLPEYTEGLNGISVGSEIILITWLHLAERASLRIHPRGDPSSPLTGVFSTRSPDRPNPLGLRRVTVKEISGNRLKVGPLEALDGTPLVDMKPLRSDLEDL